MIDFEQIRKAARPAATRNIGPLMYYLSKLVDARKTVEVGVGFGYVSLILGVHAREVGGVHYGVDIDQPKIDNLLTLSREFDARIKAVRRGSNKTEMKSHRWDLVFIDGDHTYEAVLADAFEFADKVKPGGIVVFHDYNEKYTQIMTAVDQWAGVRHLVFDGLRFPFPLNRTKEGFAVFKRRG